MIFLKHLLRKCGFVNYKVTSFSQEGEDLILRGLLDPENKGIYVDVGAFHPEQISNTKLLYDQGWVGINIDPTPDSIELFNRKRPKDINVNMGVSEKKGSLTFYQYLKPYYNTFDAQRVKERNKKARPYTPFKELPIKVDTLKAILDKHFVKNKHQKIDLLDIDVEGHEMSVLKSNDWKKYRPKVVLIEIFTSTIDEVFESPIYKFMIKKGYRLQCRTITNAFFVDQV